MATNGLVPKDESRLRFAIGKGYDELKDFDRAFINYRRANKLAKAYSHIKYAPQKEHGIVDALINNYDSERMNQPHDDESTSTKPVFIVGMPRSGTTLLEQIIASHSEAFGAGELIFWGNVFKNHEKSVLNASLNDPMICRLADECLQSLTNLSPNAIRVVDKMPENFFLLGLIHRVFPKAKIIHAKRNPIDTCLSIFFQNFSAEMSYANDLHNLAHYYREYHRLMAHWRITLPHNVFIEVPYEEVVGDQEGWSRKIIEFIGLEWEDNCLDFHKTNRKVATASQWQVKQALYTDSVERWRNYEKFVTPLMGLADLR